MNGEKITRVIVIRNQLGLHARAAAKFVKMAGGYDAEITVNKGDQMVSGLSIMGLMMLAAGPRSEIALTASGPEAAAAMAALCELVEAKFGEN